MTDAALRLRPAGWCCFPAALPFARNGGGGFLYHGRYRGIAAGLERGGIMLRGLLRLHILPGLLPLPILCCILSFRILPAQKLRLFFWG